MFLFGHFTLMSFLSDRIYLLSASPRQVQKYEELAFQNIKRHFLLNIKCRFHIDIILFLFDLGLPT